MFDFYFIDDIATLHNNGVFNYGLCPNVAAEVY